MPRTRADSAGYPVARCHRCGKRQQTRRMVRSGAYFECRYDPGCAERAAERAELERRKQLRKQRKAAEARAQRGRVRPEGWQKRAEHQCAKCGERKPRHRFPHGPEHWCGSCLSGPKPRIRIVQGGAPGMGRRNGQRRK